MLKNCTLLILMLDSSVIFSRQYLLCNATIGWSLLMWCRQHGCDSDGDARYGLDSASPGLGPPPFIDGWDSKISSIACHPKWDGTEQIWLRGIGTRGVILQVLHSWIDINDHILLKGDVESMSQSGAVVNGQEGPWNVLSDRNSGFRGNQGHGPRPWTFRITLIP